MKTTQDQTLCIYHVWPALVTILLTSFIKSLVLIVSFHVILGVPKVLETFFTFSFQMELKQIVHFNILEYFATWSMSNCCSIIAQLFFWHMNLWCWLKSILRLLETLWMTIVCILSLEEWFHSYFNIFQLMWWGDESKKTICLF
jgi:hypothetical protein